MKSLIILLAALLSASSLLAQETVTSEAPSRNEQSHIYTDGNTSVETPGKDHAVQSSREGNVEKLDYGSDQDVESVHEDDITIERETAPSSD